MTELELKMVRQDPPEPQIGGFGRNPFYDELGERLSEVGPEWVLAFSAPTDRRTTCMKRWPEMEWKSIKHRVSDESDPTYVVVASVDHYVRNLNTNPDNNVTDELEITE